MTQPNPAQVPPFDGSSGNIISRAEPKVRAASLTALLSPVALYYVYDYVPGLKGLPHQLDAVIGAVLVGALTFLAGFAAKAVNRVDLFGHQELAKYEPEVTAVADRAIGKHAVDEIEHAVKVVYDDVAPPLVSAVKTAVSGFEAAVGAGTDPVKAAEAQVKPLEAAGQSALDVAVADGRAEAPALVAEAVSGAAAANPGVAAQAAAVVSQAVAGANHNPELAAMLHQMLTLLGEESSATPIADAVAASLPSAQTNLPPVPVTLPSPNAPTAEIPAVNPATGEAAPSA